MLDIHSHILQGIDDGAEDLETSLEMLKMAKEENINSIIATPHYYRGHYENDYESVLKHVEKINEKAVENKVDIKVFPGQEVFLDQYSPKLYKEGIIKGLNNSRFMLVEFSMMNMPKDILDIIYEIRILGVVPIIAHPERYKYIIETPSNINAFLKEGCLFQINTGSISGVFGGDIKKTSETLIKHGICNFVASDAHGMGRRCPGILPTLKRVKDISPKVHDNLEENCKLLLEDKNIEFDFEEIKEKRGFFSFFKK